MAGSADEAGVYSGIDHRDCRVVLCGPAGGRPDTRRDGRRRRGADSGHGDRRQELVLIGIDMDTGAMSGALDACLATPEEMAQVCSWLARAAGWPRAPLDSTSGAKRKHLEVGVGLLEALVPRCLKAPWGLG